MSEAERNREQANRELTELLNQVQLSDADKQAARAMAETFGAVIGALAQVEIRRMQPENPGLVYQTAIALVLKASSLGTRQGR